MSSLPNYPDVFAEAKARYDVPAMRKMLGIPGEPTHGNSFSPFREESRPSFSIYDDGRKWKDHANGLGGDSIELAKVWHDFTGPELREFLMERLGIDFPDRGARVPAKMFTPTPKPPAPPKKIEWPRGLLTGREEMWEGFAERRGLSYEGVRFMVDSFLEGQPCAAEEKGGSL